MPERPLLWYVHHHGSGHLRRALAVGRHLSRPVIYASSLSAPAGVAEWNELPLDAPRTPGPAGDVTPGPAGDATAGPAGDVTAGGRLHWAPPGQPGLLARHRILLDLLATHQPALAVVDVSVEVAVLLRVSGCRVITVRLPGERGDAPHELVHAIAERVVLPVPAAWGMAAGTDTAVGLVSAIANEAVPPQPEGPILVLLGAGGSALTPAHCATIAAAASGRRVQIAGATGQDEGAVSWLGEVADPAALIAGASVVVGGAGLGTVADVARVGRPFVCVPDDRPFGEQRATAAALAGHDSACVLDTAPDSVAWWAAALSSAVARGPLQADTGGARRFAELLEATAR